MFLKLSSLAFVITLLGATTTRWTVAEDELANIHLETGPIFYLDRMNFTFGLAIGWLLTDGDNIHVEKSISHANAFYTGVAPHKFEGALFANQPGYVNGVDFQGNCIESIAFTIDDFESVYYPNFDEWNTKLNLSLVFSGRPLFPNELDLAVVGPFGKMIGYVYSNSTTMYLTAVNGSRWATLEFMIGWNTDVVGEEISYVREFGTHNIREMITDGDNGYLRLELGRGYSESLFFEGQPGCFNGIDLEGNHVQDISLVLEEASKYEVSDGSWARFSITPKFVFSGSLGDGPTAYPDCVCESECDECDDGLPKHTIAATMEILVLLTGWAWFAF